MSFSIFFAFSWLKSFRSFLDSIGNHFRGFFSNWFGIIISDHLNYSEFFSTIQFKRKLIFSFAFNIMEDSPKVLEAVGIFALGHFCRLDLLCINCDFISKWIEGNEGQVFIDGFNKAIEKFLPFPLKFHFSDSFT